MTNTVVVGAGPIGLYCALVRARTGDDVVLVDRDAGPADDGGWNRRGVMQFQHPHFFRPTVRQVFEASAPDLWAAVVGAGGIPAHPPGAPDFVTGLQCRRSTFERALREVVRTEPGVTLRTGHADSVTVGDGRVSGVMVDGAELAADLVIDASGRSGRLGDGLRPAELGGPTGFSYVSRMYQVLDDDAAAELAACSTPLGQLYDGYLVIVFPQDARTLSALIVRATDDDDLALLRHRPAYEAAVAAIPHLAKWTEPGRFEPITDVLPGGGLNNTFRGQAPDVRGLYFVGDSVCTTNPAAGRGIALGLLQAQALLGLLAEDRDGAAAAFDEWCVQNIEPWFHDHVHWDASLLRRWRGEGIDLDARLPSDVICAAAEVDPSLIRYVMPYNAMFATPDVLRPAEEPVRAILRGGWRPRLGDGPSRDELAALVVDAAAVISAAVSPAR
jgi:2-polyprenyl-6-methoxyphenol hydroxylase-like FAD-dependent oxidoreductase